ncbi:cupin domain-containing protein [Actinomadura logoneensis]|uniref:Cupin domain-containing protein n=1 Tax=Actinomadura logoneensis TaxID=2293572 RepID=A0A372JKZ2_9ACTN|nr:cupin domain-containing protein [Actinomadura logoneensis]RFU40514.1 cupin domain-containing protein [Actinomadura logoneensis]
MTVIRDAEARRTETPNGVMTSLATPTQGGTGRLAVWRVDAVPGVTGPLHVFDQESVWTFLSGAVSFAVGDDKVDLAAGDTIVIPADVTRRMFVSPDGFQAVVAAPAGTLVHTPEPVVTEGCDIAPAVGEKIVPPWAR